MRLETLCLIVDMPTARFQEKESRISHGLFLIQDQRLVIKPNISEQEGASGTVSMLRRQEKFVAIFRRLFGREAVACGVFGHQARDEKIQEIIFATGLGAAAADFESAKGMAPDNRAGARAIDVNVSRFQSGFDALDIGRAAREKSAGQRVIGAVRYFEGFIEIAHF